MTDSELRDKLAQEYSDEMFRLNPNGFTVAPYVNDDTLSDAYESGWNGARNNPIPDELAKIYGTKPCPICGDYFEPNEKLQAEVDQLRADRDECVKRLANARNEVAELSAKLKHSKNETANLRAEAEQREHLLKQDRDRYRAIAEKLANGIEVETRAGFIDSAPLKKLAAEYRALFPEVE